MMTLGSPDPKDPTSQIITEVEIDADDFSMYFCMRPIVVIGINLERLKTLLDPIIPRDIVEMVSSEEDLDNRTYRINILRAGQPDVVHVEGFLELVGDELLEIPELEYAAKITMPSSVFARICNEVSDDFLKVVISVTVEGMTISAARDNEAYIVYNSVEEPEDGVVIEMNRPVSMAYATTSLRPTARTSPLLDKVVISVFPEHLLKVEYKILFAGFIRFWVSPFETQ